MRLRVEPEGREQAVETLGVGRAGVDGQPDAPGNDVGRPGLDIEGTDRRRGALDGRGGVANADDELRRLGEGVVPGRHRRRARVARRALENDLTARVADDAGHYSQRRARLLENRALLDVDLEVAAGKRPALDECPAADAPPLLVPEHNHSERSLAGADARDRFEPDDDAERAVEHPAGGDTVQVRARPDLRQVRPRADRARHDVSGRIPLDLETGVFHPRGSDLARVLLRVATPEPIRAAPAAQRVQLVEPLECPFRCALRVHRRVLQHSGWAIGRSRVETIMSRRGLAGSPRHGRSQPLRAPCRIKLTQIPEDSRLAPAFAVDKPIREHTYLN